MGFILGSLVGAVLAYLFHPQLEKIVTKTIRNLKNRSADADRTVPEDRD